MKKHILTITALALTCMLNFPAVSFAKTPAIVVNDNVVQSEVAPQIVDGRVLVPIRVISESLGANVNWDANQQTISIQNNNKTIKLQINNSTAYNNDTAVKLDVPPELIQNRAFVPLRFIGESLNSDVAWDNTNYQVTVKQINNSRSLTGVSCTESNGQTIVSLAVGQGTNNISYLTNPNRIVIDLPDTAKAVDNQFNTNTALVSDIRVGQFTADTTRVVLDLKNQATCQTSQSTDTLTVTVNAGSSGDPSTPSTPATTQPTPPAQTPPASTNDDSTYANKTIYPNSNIVVVDPGHGGSDVGAVGISGKYEKDCNLAISLKLQDALKARGFQVIMVRQDDTFVSLENTVDISNNTQQPLCFISIHANTCGTPSVTGLETYHFYNSDPTLANLVESSILSQTGQNNRGVKEAGFYVIKYTQVPAVLVETGFLSNAGEEQFLFDPNDQTTIANAIADAVVNYKKTLTQN